MRNLLSTKHERILTMLEMIYEKKTVSLGELAEQLNISNKTLVIYIREANHMIYPIQIKRFSENKVYLEIPFNYSIVSIYANLLQSSLEYTLLETVFFNEDYTMEELSENLQASPSTLRRSIKKINAHLKPYEFQISLAPIAIRGDEIKISNFFAHFFPEKYMFSKSLPFTKAQVEGVDLLIDLLVEHLGVPSTYPDVRRIQFSTLVILTRVQQKNLFNVGNYNSRKMDLSFLSTTETRQYFKHALKVDLTEEVIIRLLPLYFHNLIAFNYEHLLSLGDSRPDLEHLIQSFSTVLNRLSSMFNTEQQNKEKLLVVLCNVYTLQFGKPYILYDKHADFNKRFQDEYASSINLIKKTISEVFSSEEIEIHSMNSYLYIILTHWKNLYIELLKNVPTRTMGLFYNTDYEHMQLLKDEINSRLPFYYEIDIINVTNLKQLDDIGHKYELILTDIPNLEIVNSTVYCLSVNMLQNDWERLIDFHKNPSVLE